MRALCLCTVYRSVRDMSQSELRDNQAKVLLLDDWVVPLVTGGSERLRGVKDCWSCRTQEVISLPPRSVCADVGSVFSRLSWGNTSLSVVLYILACPLITSDHCQTCTVSDKFSIVAT